MSETYFDLSMRLEQSFDEIDSDIMMDLRSTSGEYAALHDQLTKMKQQNPVINKVLKGAEEAHLGAEEHAILAEYLRLYRRMDYMERQQLYFRGHTDAFSYLKKINMI